jgi:hypothetical protein
MAVLGENRRENRRVRANKRQLFQTAATRRSMQRAVHASLCCAVIELASVEQVKGVGVWIQKSRRNKPGIFSHSTLVGLTSFAVLSPLSSVSNWGRGAVIPRISTPHSTMKRAPRAALTDESLPSGKAIAGRPELS